MLRPMKSGKILSILEGEGFVQKRQTGSHIVLRKDDKVTSFHFMDRQTFQYQLLSQ